MDLKELKSKIDSVYVGEPVLADLCFVQAVHESNLLNEPSKLSTYNNLFGIKGQGTAGSVKLKTWEVLKGQKVIVMAPFAAHLTIEDSIKQHKELMNRPRYVRVKQAESFDEAAIAIYKCGYATDPGYPRKLVGVRKVLKIRGLYD